MIKINELYSLQNISDCYYIDDNLNIINANTNHIKTQTLGKRGYLYVSLNDKKNKLIKNIEFFYFIGIFVYHKLYHIRNVVLVFCTPDQNIGVFYIVRPRIHLVDPNGVL